MSIENFNADVATAFARVKCAKAGDWGSEESQTACPVTACWLLHHGWRYPAAKEYIGQWFKDEYGFTRDFAEGIVHGFDNSKDKIETRYENYRVYLDGFSLGESVANRWRNSNV